MSANPGRASAILAVVGALFIVGALVLYVRQGASRDQAVPGAEGADPAQAGPPPDLGAPVPFDASITTGTLKNGLRYFVRANRQPLNRAELRLVVNAGSLVEDDDQRGLAHFVEHMAFNGTKRFPRQAIGAFMESIGMRFGPSVNATTSYDETTYALQIPTDDAATIERALLILEDWAHLVVFDPREIDKERGVVIEEWRMRRGAGARIQDTVLPVLLKGSRYADRAPIGTPESIAAFSHKRLGQFYTDWYRPDLMAVVAVGDFDPAAMARLIERRFSEIPAPPSPRPRPSFVVPPQAGTEVVVATNREATSTNVSIVHRAPAREAKTVAEYREDLVTRLALGMLSLRLSEVSQVPGGPLVTASAGQTRLVRSADVASLSATVREGALGKALTALATERERVVKFGFTPPELARQKTNTLRGFERAIAERDRQSSSALTAEYVRHVTRGEAVPGLDWEFDITKRILPGVTLQEVNAAIAGVLAEDNRVVTVAAPARAGVPAPTPAQVSAAIAQAKSVAVTPWVARVNTAPLLDRDPSPGSIVATSTNERAGLTEWTLSNGARVVLKPTDFREDQIVFSAVSPGGLSLASDEDLVPAQTAVQVVASMGFGRFGSGDLKRALTGRAVNVQPVIGPFEEGLSGGSSRDDLETMFELMYLMVTSPRRDAKIFAALQEQMRTSLANQAGTPEAAFGEALSRALSQDHPRARGIRTDAVPRMDMEKSLAFYKDRFADASDFTFVFAGRFTVDEMRPLVERFLASLPATRRKETWKDSGIRPPRGVVERVVEKGLEPKGRTVLVFTGDMPVDRTRSVALVAMAEVLQARLRDAIREELGGTYSINVGSSAARVPVGQYTVSVDFTSDPARADALVARVFEEMRRLKTTGPTDRQVQDVKAGLLRDFEINIRQNAYLVGQLAQRYQSGEPPESVWQMPEIYKSLTTRMVHEAARIALDEANYVRVSLRPGR